MSDTPTFSTWLTSEGKSIASENTPRLLHPGDILDGWRVISFIARGGNAEVYRAEHVELKTIAAIKICIENTSEANVRFKQEAQILSTIHHESLPVFHAFGTRNGHAYIITEFLQPLELPRTDHAVARFATQIANALEVLLNECFDGKPPRHWKRIIAKCTSSLPDYRFHTAPEFIKAVRFRNLQRTLLRTLFTILTLGLCATLVVIPTILRQREQAKAQEEERQRTEEKARLSQESLMREIQLIMDEK